jgi:uncharacterized protein (TIGR00645 family)
MTQKSKAIKQVENFIESLIFFARWLQAPVYLGLIVGSGLYLYKFFLELSHLFTNVVIESEELMDEIDVMLAILGLIDMSMVMNLLVIVIIGGYTIFTSRIDFGDTEDRPQWLDNIDAGILKIKLATSLASISGVHLLKTFIDIHSAADKDSYEGVVIEVIIHIVFIISALMLAWVEKLLHSSGTSGIIPSKIKIEEEKH